MTNQYFQKYVWSSIPENAQCANRYCENAVSESTKFNVNLMRHNDCVMELDLCEKCAALWASDMRSQAAIGKDTSPSGGTARCEQWQLRSDDECLDVADGQCAYSVCRNSVERNIGMVFMKQGKRSFLRFDLCEECTEEWLKEQDS